MYSLEPKDTILLIQLLIFSLPIYALLLILRKKINALGYAIDNFVEKNTVPKIILMALLFFFIVFAYLTRPIYYSVYASGVIGDSLAFANMALEKNLYIFPKHISHPFFAHYVIKALLNLKILSAENNNFKEAVFIWSSLPMRILASFGLFIILGIFRKYFKFSFLKSFLCSIFLGVSFAYWCWAIQPNCLAIGIACEIVAMFFVFKAIKTKSWVFFFLSGISVAACIYAHITTIYFCLGTSIFMLVYFSIQESKYKKFMIRNLITYFLLLAVLGAYFYFIAVRAYMSQGYKVSFTNFPAFLEIISDYHMFGRFSLPSFTKIFIMIKENFITGVVNIFGIWLPINFLEKLIILITIALAIAALTVFFVKFKEAWKSHRAQILYLLILFFVILAGFTVRNGGTHYYSIALPVNLFLLFLVIFSPTRKTNFSDFPVVIVILLILLLFAYNGFSSKNVYGGKNVRDYYIYDNYSNLKELSGEKSVYFFEPLDLYERFISKANFLPITHYYSNKFSNISWITDFKENDIYEFLKKNKNSIIYVGKDTYLNNTPGQLIFYKEKSSRFEDFYRVELKEQKD